MTPDRTVFPDDAVLVADARGGDRDAFGTIVTRYQNLACSVAYAATGSLAESEEVAQDAFLAAWHSLDELRDPSRLAAWLCGIVRNLSRNAVRRKARDVLAQAGNLPDGGGIESGAETPAEASLVREEIELMDFAVASLPPTYREPLVLYYREEESVSRVATLLGLSTDTVKQRLARGRKMVRDEMVAAMERGLRRSAPSRAFTFGVLAMLPAISGTAKAASITASSAKAVSLAKGASAMQGVGWMGAVLGPLAGLAGAWFGVQMSLKSAQSERERAYIVRTAWQMLAFVGVATTGMIGFIFGGRELAQRQTALFVILLLLGICLYVVALIALILTANRRLAQIRRDDAATESTAKGPATASSPIKPHLEYESKTRVLGLPLLSMQFSAPDTPRDWRRPAVGWIAVGDVAYGVLLAVGSCACGGIAMGAVGIGVFSFSGIAIGLLPIGGVALGAASLGGLAVGFLAFGGVAIAWKVAVGGVALAKYFALGGVVQAAEANTELAQQAMSEQRFFQLGQLLTEHGWLWIPLVGLGILPVMIAQRKAAKASNEPPA